MDACLSHGACEPYLDAWPGCSETFSQLDTINYYRSQFKDAGALFGPTPLVKDAIRYYRAAFDEAPDEILTEMRRWPEEVPGHRRSPWTPFGTADTGRGAFNPSVPWGPKYTHKAGTVAKVPWRVGSERRSRRSWSTGGGEPGPADCPATKAPVPKFGAFNNARRQLSDFFPGDRGPSNRGRGLPLPSGRRPGSAPARGRRASLQERWRQQVARASQDDWAVDQLMAGLAPAPF